MLLLHIRIHTCTLHIPWIQNLVTLTTRCGISHKNMKYAIQKYNNYFTYSITILHQINYKVKYESFLNISKENKISVYSSSFLMLLENEPFRSYDLWVFTIRIVQDKKSCSWQKTNRLLQRFKTRQHATIQNSSDSEYDSMPLSEQNGVPQQKLVNSCYEILQPHCGVAANSVFWNSMLCQLWNCFQCFGGT
jgi:hypothetical protein